MIVYTDGSKTRATNQRYVNSIMTTKRIRTSSSRPKTSPRRKTKNGRYSTKLTLQQVELKARSILIRLSLIFGVGLFCYLIYIYVVAPYRSRWQALYGKEVYPEGFSIRGIDVSHHQGVIDWEKLSKAQIGKDPISFVFIKATEGQDFLDENFNDNFYQARENGLLRGAYHYFKPNVSAKLQAQYFLKQVHLEEGDLPPVLDIEEVGNLSPEELRKASLTWLKAVEKHYHVPPILYTNYKFKVDYLNTKDFDRYPYWIAHYYVRTISYQGPWKFWQHTDRGRLNGIKGNVDLNIYNGSMYDLKRLCIERH